MIDKTRRLVPRARLYAAWVSSDTVIPPATRMDVQPEVAPLSLVEKPDGVTGTGIFEVAEPGPRLRLGLGRRSSYAHRSRLRGCGRGPRHAAPLRHTELENDDAIAAHDAGWDAYVEKLTARLR